MTPSTLSHGAQAVEGSEPTDDAEERAVPTAANLRLALQALMAGVEAGDTVVFHFSGHGSQVIQADAATQEDCLHDCLCPADMDWAGNALTDEELDRALVHDCPPGVRVTCVLDCGHTPSGSPAAGVARAACPLKECHTAARYLPPPPSILDRLATVAPQQPPRRRSKPDRSQEAKVVTLLTGCQEHQAAQDTVLDGASQGALTWAMLKVLVKSRRRPSLSPVMTQ
eukprot:EG_transcript_9548